MIGDIYREMAKSTAKAVLIMVAMAAVSGLVTGFLLGQCDHLPSVEVKW